MVRLHMIDDKVVDSPRSNDFPNLGMITRNAVHRIRMFLVFMCNDYRSSKFTNVSPNLRKNRNCTTVTMKN